MTVGDAKEICRKTAGACNKCSIRDLCSLTSDGSFSLIEYYNLMTYDDAANISTVIDIELKELTSRLEGLEKLRQEYGTSEKVPIEGPENLLNINDQLPCTE